MKKIVFAILVLFHFTCFAQGFRVKHNVLGCAERQTKAVFETNIGNYIGAGLLTDSVDGVSKLCLMGLNSQGQTQWVKKYGNPNFIYVNNIFVTRMFYKHGNDYYFTCSVIDTSSKAIGVLMKFDQNGDTLWQKIFRDSDDVIPQEITVGVDGGLLITGWFNGPSYQKILLIKTDKFGNKLWQKKIAKTGANVQDGKAIAQDSTTKKIIIAGFQYKNSVSVFDNVVILDSLGTKESQIDFSGIGGNLLDLIQTKDGNLVAVGYKIYPPQIIGGDNTQRSFAVKFSLSSPLAPIWTLNGYDKLSQYANSFNAVKELVDGRIVMGGVLDTMRLLGLPQNNLVRFTYVSPSGVVLKNSYYDYKINDSIQDNAMMLMDFDLTIDNGIIGAIAVGNSSPNPFFFVKWDSTGCDTTEAYCQMVAAGIHDYALSQGNIRVYPNPANDNIYFSSSNMSSDCFAEIYDVFGRKVLEVQLLNAAAQKIYIGGLKDGVYLISILQKGKVVATSRLIKE